MREFQSCSGGNNDAFSLKTSQCTCGCGGGNGGGVRGDGGGVNGGVVIVLEVGGNDYQ